MAFGPSGSRIRPPVGRPRRRYNEEISESPEYDGKSVAESDEREYGEKPLPLRNSESGLEKETI